MYNTDTTTTGNMVISGNLNIMGISKVLTGDFTIMGREGKNTSLSLYADVGLDGSGSYRPMVSMSTDHINDAAIFDSASDTGTYLRNKFGPLYFITNNNSNFNSRMMIDNNGKIGIGTTTPSVQLHIVNGTGTTTMAIGSGNILTKRGKLCQWNGGSYTITEFAYNSITPIYTTSTTCQ